MEEDNLTNTSYKLILKREKNFVGCLIGFNIYIDGVKVTKLKNGETTTINISSGIHEIAVYSNRNVKRISIDGDTVANVVVFGPNDFGISSVRRLDEDDSKTNEEFEIDTSELEKYKTNSTGSLFASFVAPLFAAFSYSASLVYCSAIIGFALININISKRLKSRYKDLYNTILIRNIIAILVAAISLIVSMAKNI